MPDAKLATMFDATYVINLDRSPERWVHAQQFVRDAGFPNVIRWSAVDGRALGDNSIRELQQQGMLSHDLRQFHEHGLAGEIGCALSHARVLDDIIAKGWKSALILEDDVTFAGDVATWRARLQAAFKDLPRSWDLWFLYRCFDIEHRTKRISPRTLIPYSPQGCAAFAVSAAGARKLRKATAPVSNAVDRAYMQLVQTRRVKSFAASPMLIDPGAHRSDIERSNESPWIVDGVNRPPEYWPMSHLAFINDLPPVPLGTRVQIVGGKILRGEFPIHAIGPLVARRVLRIFRGASA